MNKKKRLKYAVFIFVCFLAVIFFVANIVVTQEQFLYNTVCSVLGAERRVLVGGDPSRYQYYESDYADKESVLAAADALNERIAEEGIILLKNQGALPIATPQSDNSVTEKPKISVFGHNSINLVYGGSGSGGSSNKGAVTLYESLQEAGYEYNPVMKSFYEGKAAGAVRDTPTMGDNTLSGVKIGETPIANYTSAVRESYREYGDAALVVLSRLGGEGFDLPRTMKTSLTDKGVKIDGARFADDHYLQIDENEVDMLREAIDNFENVIVVINSSEAMELGFLDDPTHYLYTDDGWKGTEAQAQNAMNRLKGALWIGSPGKTGIRALGRVMNGSVNPSGRTVDTYARDFKKDPTFNNFGTNNVLHGNEYYTINSKGNPMAREQYLVEYEEGIYVGYRYYETRYVTEGEDGDNWYRNNVVYPLGFGLSYTSFEWELLNKKELESTVLTAETLLTLRVKVTNVGNVAGKDVVQVYVNAPYYDGGIEKAEVVMVGFGKTPLLPAAAQATAENPNWAIIEIPVKAEYFASYDYNNANGNEYTGYEIEHGNYELRVSLNAHTAVETAVINVPDDIGVKQDTVENRFDDVSGYIATYLSRTDFDGTWPQAPTLEERTVTQEFLDSLNYDGNDCGQKWEATEIPVQGGGDKTVYLYELIGKDYNDPLWNDLLNQLSVETMAEMIGTGNYHTMAIDAIGKPRTIDSDGPVGFTAFMGDPSVYGTCFYVSGCVMGATYNAELAKAMGEMVGNEGIIGNVAGDGTPYSGWYAPAVNIHRSPFSGRNWEYYSEDGYLSGVMAANVVKGAKSKGVYTFVKHFALNDQETNRNGILTWANEQSMRELYFRPFEITVVEGETTAVMSSFNRIGTVWTGGSYELLTEVLRKEWGFRGMVVTDYNYATPYMNVNQMIRAGGDLNLSQKWWPDTSATPTQVMCLRQATKNILYTVVNSNAMNGFGAGVVWKYVMPTWVMWLLIADGIIVLLLGIWSFLLIRSRLRLKKSKKDAAPHEIAGTECVPIMDGGTLTINQSEKEEKEDEEI